MIIDVEEYYKNIENILSIYTSSLYPKYTTDSISVLEQLHTLFSLYLVCTLLRFSN